VRDTSTETDRQLRHRMRWRRLGWFALLYAIGLVVTLVAATVLKWLLPGVT
jgi:hypothetical protein